MSCVPDCADAPRHHYAAAVVASNIEYCGNRRVCGTITARYTDPARGREVTSQNLYACHLPN